MRTQTILIASGAGFIGSALVRNLLGQVGIRVVNIDKLSCANNLELVSSITGQGNYEFEQTNSVIAASLEFQT